MSVDTGVVNKPKGRISGIMILIIKAKKLFPLLFLVFGLLFLMTSCVIKKLPSIEDGGLISKKPCGAPCFLGITPGITTKPQIIELLYEKNLYDFCKFDESVYAGEEMTIVCSSFNINYGYKTNIVTMVGFNPSQKISVEQIVSVYGLPDAVIVVSPNVGMEGNPGPKMFMSLFFDSLHANIRLPVEEATKYTISSDIQIDRVTYFDQNSYMEFRILAAPWEGFGVYSPTH
jgi:hypothetical protein